MDSSGAQIYDLEELPLAEASKTVDALLENVRSQIVSADVPARLLQQKLDIYLFVALSIKSREFYQTHGEWDWVVRQKYIDVVKSASYPYPISNDALGYSFELWNFTPRYFKTLEADIQPKHVTVGSMMSAVQSTSTEFVRPEFIEQCAITPKILEAFQLLKYFPQTQGEGRGFAMSNQVQRWEDFREFDYNGYKSHLAK